MTTETATGPEGATPGSALAGGWPAITIAARLAGLTAIAFLPALACGFINGDDDWNFLDNMDFRGFDWEQIRWAWTTRLVGVYQPVAWMLLELEYESFGLGPRGYHAASLLLHAANAAVLFLMTRAILARCRPGIAEGPDGRATLEGSAAIATALYAVHPLRAEVVAWASCQPYLPCALCAMLAVLAYLRAHDEGRSSRDSARWLAGSVALTIAALLCKAPAVALPAVLVILDFYPLRRLGGDAGTWPWSGRSARLAWREKLWFVVPAMAAMAIAVDARRSLSASAGEARPLMFRLAQAAHAACVYPIKSVAPFDLVAFYPFPGQPDWTSPRFSASLAAVVALSLAAWAGRRRWPGFSATWAAYLVLLAPCSGLVPMGRAMLADRYSYLSMMAWVPLLAWGLDRVARADGWRSRGRRPGLVAVGVAVAGLSALAWSQSATWRDPETLWARALAHGSAGSTDVRTALGTALARQGRLEEAQAQFAEAVRIEPDSAAARNNLGLVLLDRGRPGEATPHLLEAIRLRPDFDYAYNNLGLAMARTGQPADAVSCFDRALRARPTSVEAHNNLGFTLLGLGRRAEALAHFQVALQIRPDYAPARRNLLAALDSPGPAGKGEAPDAGARRREN